MTCPGKEDYKGSDSWYDEFYKGSAWRYNLEKEKKFLLDRILTPLGIKPGARILEIGCGQGYHTYTLHQLGYDATGNDLCKPGIDFARSNFPGPRWICGDTTAMADDTANHDLYDMIFARGHSWYHYELTEPNRHGVDVPTLTAKVFKMLKPGGTFVLQIKTDFTGRIDADGVHHNLLPNYIKLFEPLGKIVMISDWDGRLLHNEKDAKDSGRSIIIATRKQ